MNSMSKFVLGAVLLSGATLNANATVYRFTFSDTSTEYAQTSPSASNPTDVFAFLDYDTDLNQFRLFDNTADGYLSSTGGSSSRYGITGIAFNFSGSAPSLGTVSYPSSIYDSGSMSGLASTSSVPSAISGAGFDLAYTTNQRLTNGESETFAFQNFTNSTFNSLVSSGGNVLASSIAVRVSREDSQRISWFAASSVAAVPEPETYAMFLAGLGLLGFVSRRKLQA